MELEWTNTATDERFVTFEVHRRERRGDVFVDISPDVTNIVEEKKYYPCQVHCYTAPPAPDPPSMKLASASKPGADTGGQHIPYTKYTFWGLPYGSEQGFRVRAKNMDTGLVSEWSEEVFATVGYPTFSVRPITNPNPPAGPLGLSTSFQDQGVQLTWLYDVDPPTSFRIYRDGKGVSNPSMGAKWVMETTQPGPWSPPSTASPTTLPTYLTGVYVYTDVFPYTLSGQYAYKVCPVFGGGGGPGEIKIEGYCSEIVRTPVGPLGMSGSWGEKGAELTWWYAAEAPTSFNVYRDGQVVGNPTLSPSSVVEELQANPWGPPSPPTGVGFPMYRRGMYVHTDELSGEFQPPPFRTYSYKVCPVFGADTPAEGTCSGTVEVSNYTLERVDNPYTPAGP